MMRDVYAELIDIDCIIRFPTLAGIDKNFGVVLLRTSHM